MSAESDPLSNYALIISIVSLLTAAWSGWISHKALRHSEKTTEEDKRLQFVKEKAELLEIINTSRKILDRTRIEISTLKAEFDAEPDQIKQIMANYTNLFTEFLPAVTGGARQASTLWGEVFEWPEKNGMVALVHHQAKFRALLHEDQVANDSAVYCINVFKEKLLVAKEMHSRKIAK